MVFDKGAAVPVSPRCTIHRWLLIRGQSKADHCHHMHYLHPKATPHSQMFYRHRIIVFTATVASFLHTTMQFIHPTYPAVLIAHMFAHRPSFLSFPPNPAVADIVHVYVAFSLKWSHFPSISRRPKVHSNAQIVSDNLTA